MGEMSSEDLIPLSERTKDEQIKIARQGGIASGEARRRKKELRLSLIALLEADDGKLQDNICTALIKKAENGDVKAFEVIRDTVGEKPTSEVAVTGYEDMLNKVLQNG